MRPRCCPGIQPTYEELKPDLEIKAIEKAAGIQPTYEELKLILDARVWARNPRIQPTYEELKRDYSTYSTNSSPVSSLPMRN